MPTPFRRAITAFLCLATVVPAAPALAQGGVPETDRQAIEQVVRDYLLAHPEVIIEALTAFRQREEMAQAEQQREVLAANREALAGAAAGPVAGNPTGDVTLVEFFDYQCGYCKSVHPSLKALLSRDGDLRVVFKEFPILGPASLTAARAALAAERQGRYLEMHNALMELRGTLDNAKILRVAASVGLDVERLKADMEAPDILAQIERNRDLAEALGIDGTPAFVIGDEIVPGAVPLEHLQELIAQERAG
jgi:protein-disulfide isomerase